MYIFLIFIVVVIFLYFVEDLYKMKGFNFKLNELDVFQYEGVKFKIFGMDIGVIDDILDIYLESNLYVFINFM